ncbi:MAG: hypothetical protein ACO1QB_04000 [Verrucomicrobiales bacterium]
MSAGSLFVRYNRITYRWEVYHQGRKLPLFTNPSRDASIMQAISLLGDAPVGKLTIYNENDLPESVSNWKKPAAVARD